MRSLITLLLLFTCFCAAAQNDKKYKLALPDQWMGKRKILNHLTMIAPTVFTKLQDKQFCLKCNATYTLMFFYDSLVVDSQAPASLGSGTESSYGRSQAMSYYECVTTYSFKGTWVLMQNDSAIAELELVSPDEDLIIKKKFYLQRNVLISPAPGKKPTSHPNPGDDPVQYINRNSEAFNPTVDDILKVLEQKVRKIKPE
jgi:hypothetical protein